MGTPALVPLTAGCAASSLQPERAIARRVRAAIVSLPMRVATHNRPRTDGLAYVTVRGSTTFIPRRRISGEQKSLD